MSDAAASETSGTALDLDICESTAEPVVTEDRSDAEQEPA
jgi:hypothetical protein